MQRTNDAPMVTYLPAASAAKSTLVAPVPAPSPPIADGARAFAKAYQVLGGNRWIIFSSLLVSLLLAALFLAVVPPGYTATSQILIENREAKVVSGNAVLSSLSSDQYVIDTQVEIIRSAKIANQAARSVGMISDTEQLTTKQLEEVQKRLRVERLGMTFVIEIAYTSDQPDMAAAMSNAIAEAYLNDQREVKSRVVRKGQEWLQMRTAELRKEVIDADRRIQEYKARHKLVSSGDLTFGEQELAEYAKQLTEARANLAEAEARLSQRARNDYEIWQTKVKVLENGLDQLKQRLANHDKIVVRLNELKRESTAAASIYANFLTRLKETQAQDTLQTADARVISSALAPPKPSEPKKQIVVGLATAFGLSFGILLALLKDTIQDLTRTREELAAIISNRTIVELPRVRTLTSKFRVAKAANGKSAQNYRVLKYAQLHPQSRYAQAMFLLQSSLNASKPAESDRVVSVVSAQPREGRTATAVHLARYAASTGLNTILIDCNLRAPSLHEACADVPGLALFDALEAGLDLKALTTSESHRGLTVVTAPAPDVIKEPVAFLASPELKSFIDKCRNTFDLVILDTAPLGPFVDTRALLGTVDRFIVVAEAGRTPKAALRAALDNAAIPADRIACGVLNKTPEHEA